MGKDAGLECLLNGVSHVSSVQVSGPPAVLAELPHMAMMQAHTRIAS